MEHQHAACANCGSPLTGRYCQACGQSAHLHHSLLHLAEELMHSLLHFDAKGWRTLPLLVLRPGLLTRRYIDGQRTRYVSPLALFLFNGFLMFFVVSMIVDSTPTVEIEPGARTAVHDSLDQDLSDARAAVERANAALADARRTGGNVPLAEQALSSAKQDQRFAEATLHVADSAMAGAAPTVAPGAADAPVVKRGLEQLSDLKVDTGHPAFDARIRRQLHNPELFLDRVEHTAYKSMFMLIPISVPFLWLMFVGRPGVRVYDHAVFSLYSLSFMSLLIVLCALLGRIGLSTMAVNVFVIVPPVHMFLQLRGSYGLSAASALWRTVALLAVAGTAFVLFLALILMLSMR